MRRVPLAATPPTPVAAPARVAGGLVPEGRRFRGLNLKKQKRGIRQLTFIVSHAARPLLLSNGQQLRVTAPTLEKAYDAAKQALRAARGSRRRAPLPPFTLTKVPSQGRELVYLGWKPALAVRLPHTREQLSVVATSLAAARAKAENLIRAAHSPVPALQLTNITGATWKPPVSHASSLHAGELRTGADGTSQWRVENGTWRRTFPKPPPRGRFQFKVWYTDWKPVTTAPNTQLRVEAENVNAAAKKVVTAFKQAGVVRVGDGSTVEFYLTSVAELAPGAPGAAADIPNRTRFYHYQGQFLAKPKTVRRQGGGRTYDVDGVAVVEAFQGERFSVPFTEERDVQRAVQKVLEGRTSIRSIQRQSMLDKKPRAARMQFIRHSLQLR